MRTATLALCALLSMPVLAAAPPKSFPGACVDCHIKLPDGRDMRLTTLLAKKKHPKIAGLDIPASCMKCHGPKAKSPFAPLMHRIHLTRAKSPFLTEFGGDCRHCHKLNAAKGTWSIPSGPEKK